MRAPALVPFLTPLMRTALDLVAKRYGVLPTDILGAPREGWWAFWFNLRVGLRGAGVEREAEGRAWEQLRRTLGKG